MSYKATPMDPKFSMKYSMSDHCVVSLDNQLPSSGLRFSRVVSKYRHHSERHLRTGVSDHLDDSGCCSLGGELRAFCRRTKRHFSEDSGFSSCSSSVSSLSSVCDDAAFCGSDTVAAVLAAGAASDSEGSDECSDLSDEETDDVFDSTKGLRNGADLALFIAIRSKSSETRQMKALHLGRDFLDLGSNLKTNFPMRATHLPTMNLPMFLENRSQYHRLGKFGTTEDFGMTKCIKGCGFSFPVPMEKFD